ncbi:uncharacterized protein FFMR_01061 [Fusarium fujikuroi]|nr:uncharacterized protein FFMR_01061 [Fusarium fujikuroi]
MTPQNLTCNCKEDLICRQVFFIITKGPQQLRVYGLNRHKSNFLIASKRPIIQVYRFQSVITDGLSAGSMLLLPLLPVLVCSVEEAGHTIIAGAAYISFHRTEGLPIPQKVSKLP